MHKVDERVDLADLAALTEIYRTFLDLFFGILTGASAMAVTAWAEVRWALVGSLRLARGDRGGLACFDRSLDGFWRSFLCRVCQLSALPGTADDAGQPRRLGRRGRPAHHSGRDDRLRDLWVAFPLVMLSVMRWIGREHRFFDFMVPYNWCQLPQSVLFVLVGLESESGIWAIRWRRRSKSRPPSPSSFTSGTSPASRWRRAVPPHAGCPRRSRPRGGRQPRRRQPLLTRPPNGSGWFGLRGGVKV